MAVQRLLAKKRKENRGLKKKTRQQKNKRNLIIDVLRNKRLKIINTKNFNDFKEGWKIFLREKKDHPTLRNDFKDLIKRICPRRKPKMY